MTKQFLYTTPRPPHDHDRPDPDHMTDLMTDFMNDSKTDHKLDPMANPMTDFMTNHKTFCKNITVLLNDAMLFTKIGPNVFSKL